MWQRGPVAWTFLVRNTGQVGLGDVVLTDDQATVTFVDGDTDGDNVLDVGEVWRYEASGIAQPGDQTNAADVVANPVDQDGLDLPGLDDVADQDTAHYFGVVAGVTVEKLTNDLDAGIAPGPALAVGSEVTCTYIVSNTGIGLSA